jgi:hypothetical protein
MSAKARLWLSKPSFDVNPKDLTESNQFDLGQQVLLVGLCCLLR